MNRTLVALATGLSLLAGCSMHKNPLLEPWTTPFGTPPFDAIKEDDYPEAFARAMADEDAEIAAIAEAKEAPTFANTIEAFEHSGETLSRVAGVFESMLGSMSDDRLQAIARDLSPQRTQHRDNILLNARLFARIKEVHARKDSLKLEGDQKMLLQRTYERFVRGGALLDAAGKERLRALNNEIALLEISFDEHLLAENNAFKLVLHDRADLAGLPDGVIAAAAEAAKERGQEGKWVFTLHKPSMIPFLQYSSRRDLRETIYRAYLTRGSHGDSLDNTATVKKIVTLRAERARLLGFANHAAFVLDDCMAKTPAKVDSFLASVWTPALHRAAEEAKQMQKIIDREHGGFALQSWDWWYYAEKVRKEQYDLDETTLRPYFELRNVRKGVFDLAGKLYGLTFTPRTDIPVYHKDVEVFEVKGADGGLVGILYVDYFPRASKRGGAWMGNFREQSRRDGVDIRPIVFNVGNFTKPTGDTPALLSMDEVLTLFHEFGHSLHSLLSRCTYESLAGTSVPTDFVELPSQIMENWAFHPAVLQSYARHYATGQPMPDSLVAKIRKARFFNQGFETTEYIAAALLDMAWHELDKAPEGSVGAFERELLQRLGLPPSIESRYWSTYFSHIFGKGGEYSAGYYSYLWAAVLDADAFRAFEETGNVLDAKTAASFRDNVLSRGRSEDPMTLYVRFRGKQPDIKALLERRGLR